MTIKLSNWLRVLTSLFPQDVTTQRTGAYLDVSASQEMLAIVTTGTVAAGSQVTLQPMQATDTTGANAKALGDPIVTTAPTGGSTLSIAAPIAIADLDDDNGFSAVALRVSSNNGTAVQATGTLLLGNNRFNP